MSVRTYDPVAAQIYPPANCSAGCGEPYDTICKLCNLAYCALHLKPGAHVCDSKAGHVPYPAQEFEISVLDLPPCWNPSPKGCWAKHPESGELCQLPPDGHATHAREHPNGKELETWIPVANGKA